MLKQSDDHNASTALLQEVQHIILGNRKREFKAQGVGNMISGLIGGLPITSVIVRSTATIDAVAKTKVSTVFQGLLLRVCTAFIPGISNMIPLGDWLLFCY
jgi:MFS superfamily sulfate permease-like transporter